MLGEAISDWSTTSLAFDWRALLWKLSDFEVPSLCGNLYLQLGCVTAVTVLHLAFPHEKINQCLTDI